MKNKTILLIDGENFLFKIRDVLKSKKISKKYYPNIDKNISNLLKSTLKFQIDSINFYSAKLKVHKETKKKSLELIAQQRIRKNLLEKQGITFVVSGNVRPQMQVDSKGKVKHIFKEKGVDVRIAVDMVSYACDKKYQTIVLCSSDSDLQPAIQEVKRRGVNLIYLGFTLNPNRGLKYTANKTVLIDDNSVVNAIKV